MIQLPPSEFTFGRYDNTALPWSTIKSMEAYLEHLLSLEIIGYCDGAEIPIRSRLDDMAVMLKEDDWEFWCHIPKDVWNKYLEVLNGN